MSAITLDSVLGIEQLMFQILPMHVTQIVKNGTKANVANDFVRELNMFWEQYSKTYFDSRKIMEVKLIKEKHGDDAKGFFNTHYDVLRKFADSIDLDKLILMLALDAVNSLEWLDKTNKCVVFCYDIYKYQENTRMTLEDTIDLKQRLVEGILYAKSLLKGKQGRKVDNIVVDTVYDVEEVSGTQKMSKKMLVNLGQSELVLSNLNYDKINEYIAKGLIQKHELIRIIQSPYLPRDVVIHILSQNCIYNDAILKDVFKVSTFKELLSNKDFTTIDRMQLYSAGLITIRDLEENMEQNPETQMPTKESYEQIARYYRGNITKLTELLSHNVLDFKSSIEFLDYLQKKDFIGQKEKESAIQIMNDFKVKQLDAREQNGTVVTNNIGSTSTHRKGLCLEPQVRNDYLRSIGRIKQIFVDGSNFIKDESETVTEKIATKRKKQRNSLDGYELFIIPEKGVAILEKNYEVTRNKDGNIEYRKNSNGKLIPAIENATYIMPIAMAKELIETRNKQQLMRNPYVVRVAHTRNWVNLVENGIKKVCSRVGMDVEFDKENTDIWSQKVKDNYDQLLMSR